MHSTFSSGSLAAVAFNNPIETLPEFDRHAKKNFECWRNVSPLDF